MSECIIVIPCYNEAERLDVRSFQEFIQRDPSVRFLFVNDGSTDQTQPILRQLCQTKPGRFELYELKSNMGKAEAVRQGILNALASQPDFVGFWDADLATPLSIIPEFYQVLKNRPELQMVFGARVKLMGRTIERRTSRHYLGRVFATVASLMLGLSIYDTQCGAKLFRTSDTVRFLFDEPFQTNWIFDVELLARFLISFPDDERNCAEQAIYEYPLMEWRDVAGSKVKPRHFAKAGVELWRIYRAYLMGRRRRGTRPALSTEFRLQEDVPSRRRSA